MSTRPLDTELDPTPLVRLLLEKTKAGKVAWEATADPQAFIASSGGKATFKIYLAGEDETFLASLDEKGKTLLIVNSGQVQDFSLESLYRLAKRIANKLDEKLAILLETVEKL